MAWQERTIEWRHGLAVNHGELLDYNYVAPLHQGLQGAVTITKDRVLPVG